MTSPIKYITFKNNSSLPVIVESFVDGSISTKCVKIGPKEIVDIHSSVGEWHLHSMLGSEDRKIWNTLDNGKYKHITIIGKFRSNPCASNNHSWIDHEDMFNCVYSENSENVIKGLITFSLTNGSNVV
jgi:hypothetical protein